MDAQPAAAVRPPPLAPARRRSRGDTTRVIKAVVFVNALWPLYFLVTDAMGDRLGANPIDYVTRATGTLTLLFLALTLAITPISRLPGLGSAGRLRRMIGLFAFFYGTLHLATYVAWDQEWNLGDLIRDVAKRRFVLVGMAAWLLMAPLALTSTNGMAKRLGGRAWKRLHRLTYVVAGLGVLHFYMLLKVPTQKLWVYGLVVAAALALRPIFWLFARGRRRQSSGKPGGKPVAAVGTK